MNIKGENQGKAFHLKLLILGESSIGKTCIIERYVKNSFNENYIATIGMDIRIKRLEINNCDVEVAINDTAGQERFRSLTKMFYKGADGILVGFDLTNKDTFDKVNYWIGQIEENKNKDYLVSLVLFGNKCDKKQQIVVNEDDIASMKRQYNLEFFATSAKDGTNVQEAFEYLIKKTLKAKGLLGKIGLSPDIPFDDIAIKVKEDQKLGAKSVPKKKKNKKRC